MYFVFKWIDVSIYIYHSLSQACAIKLIKGGVWCLWHHTQDLTSLSTQDLKEVHDFILMTDDKFFLLTLYPVSRASAQETENTGKI